MIRPLDSRYDALYYDGFAPVRRPAVVQLESDGLRVAIEGGSEVTWPSSEFKIAEEGSYGEPVRIEGSSGDTLVIESPEFFEALRQHGLVGSALSFDLRGWPAVLMCCLAVGIIGGLLYTQGVKLAADQAARFMPAAMEKRLGLSVVSLLAPVGTRCTDAAARHRLDPIVDRLRAAAGPQHHFEMIYVNRPIVNAFAAPGGYIVVFRGLLEETRSPEEFAGVLAHEMEHVILRHSARALAREFSGRALLSLMAVDSSGTPTAFQASVRLANLSYQRSDEEAADLAGAALLARAHIRTDGLATFLRRLQTNPALGEPPSPYLSTHPAMEERIEALQATPPAATPSQTLMSSEEWDEARRVCAVE
jgi:predicted Zn-dependent protease